MVVLIGARAWGLAILALCLAACSDGAEGTDDRGPHDALFEAELERDLSEFSRAILEDKVITGAEYQEADARYVECVNEFFEPYDRPPFASVIQPDGSQAHTFEGTDDEMAHVDRVEPECMREYLGDGAVQYLYWAQIDDPENKGVHQLMIDCLVRKGLADPQDYGIAQLEADITADFASPDEWPVGFDESVATDVDLADGEGFRCYAFQE